MKRGRKLKIQQDFKNLSEFQVTKKKRETAKKRKKKVASGSNEEDKTSDDDDEECSAGSCMRPSGELFFRFIIIFGYLEKKNNLFN